MIRLQYSVIYNSIYGKLFNIKSRGSKAVGLHLTQRTIFVHAIPHVLVPQRQGMSADVYEPQFPRNICHSILSVNKLDCNYCTTRGDVIHNKRYQ